jgi:type VI secretion system protein ImpE
VEALKLLNQGLLDEAIDAAREVVKENPMLVEAREIFAELLCLKGDLERADKQLETIVIQQPQASITAVLLRQLIRGELARRECWNEGRVPEFVGQPDWVCKQTLEAWVAMRDQAFGESLRRLEEIEEQQPMIEGVCDDQPFEGFRDMDDTCLAIFEVLTSTGKYFWIPFSQVEQIEFAPVVRPRDLIWRQCQMSVQDGPDGVVYMPVLYQATSTSDDLSLKLGRSTDWRVEDEHPIIGVGQRVFAVGDRELGILEIEKIELKAKT